MNYSGLSYQLTKDISKDIKKNNGIYFTPPSTISKMINLLSQYLSNTDKLLEPSCGSCEFVLAINNKYPKINITGIELNQTIYDAIKHYSNNKINLINDDFLLYKDDSKYDIIIGNPPYYVMKKNKVKKDYYKFFDGRPNIFILFIIKSIQLLSNNGILSFVLPKNFTNCIYYNKTREYINENYTIIDIIDCNDKYIETQQDTIIFIIQKKKNNDNNDFVLKINNQHLTNNFTIFGTKLDIEKIKNLYQNSTSLYQLGFRVSVGTVVWNQCKSILTDDSTKTRLIYSSDIKNNKLICKKYKDDNKKNFINKSGYHGLMLVINRGYGVGSYQFEYCLIDADFEYLIENHLMCLIYTKEINYDDLFNLYQKIIRSLNNLKTIEFVKTYFGNNAINTTELNYILPIYDN